MIEPQYFTPEVLNNVFYHSDKGIILLDSSYTIQAINPKAASLLQLTVIQYNGLNLKELYPQFFSYGNTVKETVVVPSGTTVTTKLIAMPDIGNCPGWLMFLEATPEMEKWNLLAKILNSMDDAIMVCDAKGCLNFYNDANQRMDGLLRDQVLGKHVTNIYMMTENQSLLLKAMKDRKPILNQYQNYQTFTGRNLNIVCSTYPLIENNVVIGAVSVMKDQSQVTELYNKVIDLQEVLFEKNKKTSPKRPVNQTRYSFIDIIGYGKAIDQAVILAKRAAKSSSHVLIYGETGTGKELFAQSVHNASPRASRPFVAVNCAAIPENLLEGILFGTTKGAFTGAIDRPGLFEQANGGTLLLDELNSMSIGLQAKLLRVIQDGVVRRLGNINELLVDVRIIGNINVPPAKAIKEKQLREDLFYRLSAVYLEIPALRLRTEDIPLLASTFIDKFNKILDRKVKQIAPNAMDILYNYSWPGNVREFEHAIESAMNMIESTESVLELHHFPTHIRTKYPHNPGETNITITLPEEPLCNTLDRLERLVIYQVLLKNKWNVSQTARQLDIKRQSLQYRMRKYALKRNRDSR